MPSTRMASCLLFLSLAPPPAQGAFSKKPTKAHSLVLTTQSSPASEENHFPKTRNWIQKHSRNRFAHKI